MDFDWNSIDGMSTRAELLKHLEETSNVLSNEDVRHAFEIVDRANFVGDDYKVEAYEDYPLPIGHGQTISQPTTVAFMLELLEAEKGQKVLDVGSGSGWTTALLSDIVGDEGYVYGTEIVPELAEVSRDNLEKQHVANAEIRQVQLGDMIGIPEEAPFDRILVNAAAEEMPEGLLPQLAIGGTLVIPVKESIFQIKRVSEDDYESKEFPGFVFVPLV